MLPVRDLGQTGVATSAVGFGCAGLFRLPRREDRTAVLEATFEAGIRHFDVAPMYGFGLAESELGTFLRRRRAQATVTTKFGIQATILTKTLAPLQRPARAVLARRPAANETLRTTAKNSDSGLLGQLLYRSPELAVRAAQRSLEASLRALRTDYVDVFLLHDPIAARLPNPLELADYLDGECKAGRIRCWGVTGMPAELHDVRASLRWPAVLQHRDDVLEVDEGSADAASTDTGSARITYGALAQAVGAFRQYFAEAPDAASAWSKRLGVDVQSENALPQLLLQAALARNPAGPVLFSSTKPGRVRLAAETAARVMPAAAESEAFTELTSEVRAAVLEVPSRQ
ncbi:MAG: aldo/keto reductase [Trebonia sp.]|jgi:D-threo-aldose 1-dehydrogenase